MDPFYRVQGIYYMQNSIVKYNYVLCLCSVVEYSIKQYDRLVQILIIYSVKQQCDRIQYRLFSIEQHRILQHCLVQYSIAQLSLSQYGKVQYGLVQYGVVYHRISYLIIVQYIAPYHYYQIQIEGISRRNNAPVQFHAKLFWWLVVVQHPTNTIYVGFIYNVSPICMSANILN